MNVVEEFISINGEGACAGELAYFVRFKGCNLCCSYCDTQWANNPNCPSEKYSPQSIAERIAASTIKNVTLTGGEPLLQPEMTELLENLSALPLKRVEIETNGSVDLTPFCGRYKPVFTMDYKLPSSGFETMMKVSNFSLLQNEDSVKFVIGSEDDLKRAIEITKKYNLFHRCRVFFSPVYGAIDPTTIVDSMISNRINHVRFQIQLHKVVWHPNKRGV